METSPLTGEQRVAMGGVPLHETWAAMEKLVDDGLVKSIGVSNCELQQLVLATLLSSSCCSHGVGFGESVHICAHQAGRQPRCSSSHLSSDNWQLSVELHPKLQQKGLLTFCREYGVHLTAYAPLVSQSHRNVDLSIVPSLLQFRVAQDSTVRERR